MCTLFGCHRCRAQWQPQWAFRRTHNLRTPKSGYMVFLVDHATLENRLVCFFGLAGRGEARGGPPALPLRVLLENAKNGSAAMAAHSGCLVCQNSARGWQNGFMCGPGARRASHWPMGGWRWPSAIIYFEYQSKVFEKDEKSPKLFSQWYPSGIVFQTMKRTRTHEPAGGGKHNRETQCELRICHTDEPHRAPWTTTPYPLGIVCSICEHLDR